LAKKDSLTNGILHPGKLNEEAAARDSSLENTDDTVLLYLPFLLTERVRVRTGFLSFFKGGQGEKRSATITNCKSKT
jgi:hypothetical protein